jgi:hypothetical protein
MGESAGGRGGGSCGACFFGSAGASPSKKDRPAAATLLRPVALVRNRQAVSEVIPIDVFIMFDSIGKSSKLPRRFDRSQRCGGVNDPVAWR